MDDDPLIFATRNPINQGFCTVSTLFIILLARQKPDLQPHDQRDKAEMSLSNRSWHPLRFMVLLTTQVAIWAIIGFGGMAYGDPESQSGPAAPISRNPKTIIDLQPFRQSSAIPVKGAGEEEGLATLIQLNPSINDWFLLQLSWHGGTMEEYHLENKSHRTQKVLLEDENPYGLVIIDGEKKISCQLWGPDSKESLKAARVSRAAYAPLCGGRLFLRNPVKGHQTRIEAVTDFLRDEIPAGEEIVTAVRDKLFADTYREKAETAEEPTPAEPSRIRRKIAGVPEPARIDSEQADRLVVSSHLGIALAESTPRGLIPGNWYAAKDQRGLYVSLIVPNMIARGILRSYRSVVSSLDKAESEALVYLVAFDLDQFDLKFSLGTEHPRVGWSDRARDKMKDKALPGPDGIGTIAPLISTGLVNPRDAGRTVATFTGGFKRAHGAFKWGQLSLQNHGSHYGFLENGVVFSRLQPGLSTLYVLTTAEWI